MLVLYHVQIEIEKNCQNMYFMFHIWKAKNGFCRSSHMTKLEGEVSTKSNNKLPYQLVKNVYQYVWCYVIKMYKCHENQFCSGKIVCIANMDSDIIAFLAWIGGSECFSFWRGCSMKTFIAHNVVRTATQLCVLRYIYIRLQGH